jgi:hypothetical protein
MTLAEYIVQNNLNPETEPYQRLEIYYDMRSDLVFEGTDLAIFRNVEGNECAITGLGELYTVMKNHDWVQSFKELNQ